MREGRRKRRRTKGTGPPFGEPGAGKLSGAGSLESRPRNQEKEVKTGKRAMKAGSGP